MNFFKSLLASMLGTFLAIGLMFIVIVVVIIAAVSSGSEREETHVHENSILHIVLNQPIAERVSDNDMNFDPITLDSKKKVGLQQFIEDLEKAKRDEKIKGVFLEPINVMGAPSTLLDVHNAIEDFKNSGKFVVAFAENFGQSEYYIASAANEVYMYPEGTFDWRGMNAEIMYYKKMFDKLGVEAQVIRGPNNKYKSAVEPFIYDHMSDENRAQVKLFIDDIWNTMLNDIAESRKVEVAQLNMLADSLSFASNDAVAKSGLVDGLRYRDEVMASLKTKVGLDATADDDDMHMIGLADYRSQVDADRESGIGKEKVAIVYAVGGIESGEGDDETIGSERIAEALKEARENEKVKAIVLRVNSPGGSALASDVIWRETELIKQSGKPFYVSMGDYAASGGYYIACSADKIYANPNTITGSIGVFGVIPNMQKFLDEKLGITFDRYETNPHADLVSVVKPLDATEMKAMQTMIGEIYNDFTAKVAKGRNMTQAQVDSIGQGRVWSGEDAKAIGLVDELGDLDDCVKAAAQAAGISDYSVKELPTMVDPLQKLVEQLTGSKEAGVAKELLGEHYEVYRQAKAATQWQGVQARLPFVLQLN
jgi:protease-4